MQCEFSWSHVQRTSIRVAAATSIQFSSPIYTYIYIYIYIYRGHDSTGEEGVD